MPFMSAWACLGGNSSNQDAEISGNNLEATSASKQGAREPAGRYYT
jgi:hypothetical protein